MKKQFILNREKINYELQNIFEFPLTLVVAAMGYGKTTSIRGFLNNINANYIWLSLESNESSPQNIWHSFTRQLIRTKPIIGAKLRDLGFPSNSVQRNNILNIIEENIHIKNTILVFDDYHFANSSEFNKFIEQLVRSDIDGLHILILSRIIPKINIEELTLKEYCYQIESQLFEVDIDEIKTYFNLYDYNISEEIATKIYEISEGWISALYLMLQRYSKIGKLEPCEKIENLIEKVVISNYTSEELLLLKSLCILDIFTPKQAVYVTNQKETELIIKQLSYENSFIRYDEREDMYRIHNIFSNYLKKCLEQNPLDLEINVLYKRSGEWCLNNGDILSGLNYLLKAKEYDLILNEFEKNYITQYIDNNPKYILELFEKIPSEFKYKHPIAFINFIGFKVTNIDIHESKQLLSKIEEYYKSNTYICKELKEQVMGELELIKGYLSFNDLSKMEESFSKAYKLLNGNSSIANINKNATFGSPHILYLYYRKIGEMSLAVDALDKAYPYYMKLSKGCGIGYEYQNRAEYYLEIGDLKNSEIWAYKAIYKAESMNQVSVIICANFTLARICLAKGEFEKTVKIMSELNDKVEQCNSSISFSTFDVSIGYVGGIIMDIKLFPKWLCIGDLDKSEILYQGMGFNYIVYGKYLLLTHDYIKLEMLCEEMLEVFSKFNNQLGYIHSYILDSIAKYNIYGIKKAKIAIQLALDIGKVDHIVLPFAEYSIYIIEILKDILKDNIKDKYLIKLLSYVTKYYTNIITLREIKSPVILTNREKQVLELIIQGKTNAEISSQLYIAEVTVRKNITSIYKKLQVTKRTAAVKKALELKIV